LIFSWNEYFFAAVLTATRSVTLPLLIATQVSSQGISGGRWRPTRTAAILPLTVVGILLERYIVKGLTAGAVK
jgi:multiple sugar transport system permease protein